MVFRLLIFIARKPGTSHDDFRNRYENEHVPIIKKKVEEVGAQDLNPYEYKRTYLHLDKNGIQGEFGPMPGMQVDDMYDIVIDTAYTSKEQGLTWHKKVEEDGVIKKDREEFADHDRMKVIVVEQTEGGL